MENERRFPVLGPRPPGAPMSVPWGLLSPHETNALIVHGQTLERLASRGGLGVSEMVQVIDGGGFRAACRPEEETLPRLLEAVREYEAPPLRPAREVPTGPRVVPTKLDPFVQAMADRWRDYGEGDDHWGVLTGALSEAIDTDRTTRGGGGK